MANLQDRRAAAMSFLGYAAVGIGGVIGAFWLLSGRDAGFAALFWCLAVWVARHDLATYTIPNLASALIATLGLTRAALGAELDAADRIGAMAGAAACGLGALMALWIVKMLYRWFAGHDGLGMGDVKLAGAAGVWLEVQEQAVALQLAALAALIVLLAARRRAALAGQGGDAQFAIPFGPFLALAAVIVHVLALALQNPPGAAP